MTLHRAWASVARWARLVGPAFCCTISAPLATPATAQSVAITVREASRGAPAAGAIVKLIRNGVPQYVGLADEFGRVTFSRVVPGTYRVRADRIGFSGLSTEPFEVPPDGGWTGRQVVTMPATPVELPALEVAAESGCVNDRADARRAAALWEEVGKALTANVLTEQERRTSVEFSTFERLVTLGGAPIREWVVRSGVTRGPPFGSLPPAELQRSGFVAQEGDSTRYAALDAHLLLSDEFVAAHCFRMAVGLTGMLGLQFAPVPTATLPDVSGTLWVDRATRELRYLEFRYVMTNLQVEPVHPPIDIGGRVEFRRLRSGRWIVADWVLRMPRLASRIVNVAGFAQKETRIIGYVERGGHAAEILDPRADTPPGG